MLAPVLALLAAGVSTCEALAARASRPTALGEHALAPLTRAAAALPGVRAHTGARALTLFRGVGTCEL